MTGPLCEWRRLRAGSITYRDDAVHHRFLQSALWRLFQLAEQHPCDLLHRKDFVVVQVPHLQSAILLGNLGKARTEHQEGQRQQRLGGKRESREVYLNSSAPIGQFMQAVRKFGIFCLDKWVIECPAVELFEAMDCIFEVCYDLKFGDNQHLHEVTFGDLNINYCYKCVISPGSWLRFQLYGFWLPRTHKPLKGNINRLGCTATERTSWQILMKEYLTRESEEEPWIGSLRQNGSPWKTHSDCSKRWKHTTSFIHRYKTRRFLTGKCKCSLSTVWLSYMHASSSKTCTSFLSLQQWWRF